jgi:hypothetical protein
VSAIQSFNSYIVCSCLFDLIRVTHPLVYLGVDKVGFDSGFRIVDAILPDPPKFTLRINDTDPIFFYCGAPGSCIDWQMVGVINPNASVSLEVQKEFAANSSFMLLPGEDWPDEAETPFTTTTTSATSSATASSTSTGSAAGSGSEATESHSHGLSTGAIAGIAIGNFYSLPSEHPRTN